MEVEGQPIFQVIVLGASGGPREDTVTGMLVRSIGRNWAPKSLIAVDAGTLLAGIARTIDSCETVQSSQRGKALQVANGPFAGLELPNKSSLANATWTLQELIDTVLVSHPHLDHMSALALNSPAGKFKHGRISIAGLPSVIAALKNHVFNDIIWPNLSDEDGGVGLISYRRLTDEGSYMLGTGSGEGYTRVCQGIVAKCIRVAHGTCSLLYDSETGSHQRLEGNIFSVESLVRGEQQSISMQRRRSLILAPSALSNEHDEQSLKREEPKASTDSSAFFLRDEATEVEILVFGDVEPDEIAKQPRNARVWEHAAPKIISGKLRAIFIECSYTDATENRFLFGHLCPRHLVTELAKLATTVDEVQRRSPPPGEDPSLPKPGSAEETPRLQTEVGGDAPAPEPSVRGRGKRRGTGRGGSSGAGGSGSGKKAAAPEPTASASATPSEQQAKEKGSEDNGGNNGPLPLTGLKVYIIHIKDPLEDVDHPRDLILEQLRDHSQRRGLGCEFYAPLSGEAVCI